MANIVISTDNDEKWFVLKAGYSNRIIARQDPHNCGVTLIGDINLQGKIGTKNLIKLLKSTINSKKYHHLHHRRILMGTINQAQLDGVTGTNLKKLGFTIGTDFINPNTKNKCYVITADINKLKI